MPWDDRYKKQGVRGVSANAIDVVIETGDSGPVTPVGINLPNDQTIREEYGSKSVSLSNVTDAYDQSTPPEFRREFAWSQEEAERAEKWSSLASELTTNMHEVIGHGSGRISEQLQGSPQSSLKEQYSALEESRADLVALYFLPDPQARRARARRGSRPPGDRPRRVRSLRAQRAGAASPRPRGYADRRRPHAQPPDDRRLADGELRGDRASAAATARPTTSWSTSTPSRKAPAGCSPMFSASRPKATTQRRRQLFETYGVHFDPALRDEVVARVDRLQMPSYTGFVQPRLEAERDGEGTITDVTISYPQDLTQQMLEYSGKTKR